MEITEMDIIKEKALLRSRMRRICKNMDLRSRKALSDAACVKLSLLDEFLRAEYILAYMAMPHECDPAKIVEMAWSMGKKVAFPVCEEEHRLGLYIPAGADAFVPGSYGILEPDIRKSVRIAPSMLDCIIVPGVAFDEAGNRLGQGAGYYDRLLADTGAVRMGFCFPSQIVERVPAEEHDRRMNAVISADKCFFTHIS